MNKMMEVRVFKDADGNCQLMEWLAGLKRTDRPIFAKCLAYIKELRQQGSGLRRPLSGSLRDGIFELRPKTGRINYRILYFFHNRKAFLARGITKEKEVPDVEIDRALAAWRLIKTDESTHTATLPDDFKT